MIIPGKGGEGEELVPSLAAVVREVGFEPT